MREKIAWLLWCANQGYIKAEDRAVGEGNWFLDDPSTLHRDDLASRDGWLSMADEVIAAIRAETGRATSGRKPKPDKRDIGPE